VPQSQDGSFPVNQPKIIVAAQPTFALTVMAEEGQFFAQAPHSMQLFLSKITAMPPSAPKTPCGHTSVHFPHFVHLSCDKCNVWTFFKYLCFIKTPF
jgi:hypothetical protein